jgi:hypothetical protein
MVLERITDYYSVLGGEQLNKSLKRYSRLGL